MTGVVDEKERRNVAVLDIANAFLQADNAETVNMLLRGKLAEMMVRIDSALYREYVMLETIVSMTSMLYRILK